MKRKQETAQEIIDLFRKKGLSPLDVLEILALVNLSCIESIQELLEKGEKHGTVKRT
jgi:hypothetical protein